jgi:hypothetical protein
MPAAPAPPAPAPAPAAPSPAPAPAPSPSPAPAPAPAPAPSPAPPTKPSGQQPDPNRQFKPGNYDDLDALGDEPPPTPTPAPAPAPKPGITGPAPAPDPADADVPAFKTNKELREWAKTRHSLAKEKEKKAAELEVKLVELEKKVGQNPQTEELSKRIATLNQQVEDYEAQMRVVNWRKSKDYRENFETKLNQYVEAAHREMGELDVSFTDEEGEVTTRQATPEDFNRIYNLPAKDARAQAKAMFGDAANDVLAHRRRIRELSEEVTRKEQEYEKQGAEQEKQRVAQQQTEAEAAQRMFRQVNEDLATKYPQWFKEADGDDEGNEMLRKGYALVDTALGPKRAELSLQDRIILDARIRNQAAGFMRQAHQLKKLKAQLAEKDKIIEELRGSGPGAPNGAGSGPVGGEPPPKNWEDGFESAVPA